MLIVTESMQDVVENAVVKLLNGETTNDWYNTQRFQYYKKENNPL